MYVCLCTVYIHSGAHRGQKKSARSLVTGVISCESLCVCWKLNPCAMEEQPVFITTEPFLHLLKAMLSGTP